jgi:hypothetical protein
LPDFGRFGRTWLWTVPFPQAVRTSGHITTVDGSERGANRKGTKLSPSKSGSAQPILEIKVRFCRGTCQTAERPGVFLLSCWEAIPPIPHRTIPGTSPEPRRSTSVPGTEVLRRGSGEATEGLRSCQWGVKDAAAPIPTKIAKSPMLIGKAL